MKRYAIAFILLLWLAYAHTAQAAIEPQLTADFWFSEYTRLEAIYRSQWHDEYSPCVALPLRDAATLTWRDARYSLPSYIDMYQWSGDPVWLSYFVERAGQILGYRSDPNGDGLWGWYTERHKDGERLVHEMAIGAVLVRFANVAGHLYPTQATEYRAVGEYIIAKWAHTWAGHNYIESANWTVPPRELPYNQLAIAGLLHYELGNAAHVEAIANTIRSGMRPGENGGLIWNYAAWHKRVEDINHAGQVASFAAVAMPDVADGLQASMLGIWRGGGSFAWRLDDTEQIVPPRVPYYRHMELGPALYDAVAASWLYLLDQNEALCRPGSYLSVPSLVLLHQFPQQRTWLPIVIK